MLCANLYDISIDIAAGQPGISHPPTPRGRPPCRAINSIPEGMQLQRDLMVGRVDYFDSIRLIPDMKFTCSGTVVRVRVAGRPQQDFNQSMKMQIWRANKTENGIYYHRINDIALPSACEMDKLIPMMVPGPNKNDQIPSSVYECKVKQNIAVPAVKTGDVLGIELPPEHSTSFKIYSAMATDQERRLRLNFIFERNLSSTIDLELHSAINNETAAQPLIIIELSDRGM